MKKLIALVGLSLAVILPFGVKAVGKGEVKWVCPDSCTTTAGDKCQTVCNLSIVADQDLEIGEISGTIKTGEGIVLKDVKLEDGWSKLVAGNDVTFNADPAKVGKDIKVGSLTFEYGKDIADCSIYFESELYPKAAGKLPKDENEPTGAALPIVLLVSAVGVAGIFYYVSKKNAKMHEI